MTTAQPQSQKPQDLLRFITCGSVDDGKSTLIGRLLWESQHILEDQLQALQKDSVKHGTQGAQIDYALLVDGLAAEREQGITIDVAYRYFASPRRKYIVADTPGHEQYTRNMITGASTAQAAVLLVDASQGLLTQTRRHAYLVSLMGLRHVILAVNKMDLVNYQRQRFEDIQHNFSNFAKNLGFESITAIPVSALNGDNITTRTRQTPWYQGPTLMASLETIPLNTSASQRLILPVQSVNRPHANFRGYSGTLAEGRIKVGDTLRVTQSGHTAQVQNIVTYDGNLAQAQTGQAITIQLDKEIDISRGDILTHAQQPLELTDHIEATLIWLHEDAGMVGRTYDIKLATQWASASISQIKHRIDVNTLTPEPSKKLQLNDISLCTLSLSQPLAYDSYANNPTLGGFILVDRFTHATVGAGLIKHSLRRGQNVHAQALSITRADREHLNGHAGKVIWFTGLSGSGKSTIANALEQKLHAQGQRTYILDGDNIRQGLNKDLGFTDEDRVENIRRVAEVAKLMLDAGLVVLTAFISPFRAEREMARQLIGPDRFVEVFVDTPLEVCEQRDPKGLYKKARAGLLPNLTGIGSPYEPPVRPEILIQPSADALDVTVQQLLKSCKL